jgi:membrane protein implicated in regulation of membrane protease activity
MAVTLHADQTHGGDSTENRETFFHFMARESRLVLRWIVIASLIATLVMMMTIFYWAPLPAFVLLMSYCLLILANEAERRSTGPHDEELESEQLAERRAAELVFDPVQEEQRVIHQAVDDKIFRLIVGVAIVAVALAIVVAGVFAITQGLFNWQVIGLGILMIAAYAILVSAPMWLGMVNDEAEIEQHRIEEQLHGK